MSKFLTKIRPTLLLLLVFGVPAMSATALAESQNIAVNQQSQQSSNKPKHGQSMQQVETQFGQPAEQSPAVGEPPITRWRYNDFTVYFEHDKVIHSVSHRA